MFPDLFNATVGGKPAIDQVDMEWYEQEYIPRVGKRGAEVLNARGASSAASAANAAIDHVRDWVAGADGPALDGRRVRRLLRRRRGDHLELPRARCSGGAYEIEQGLDVGDFAQAKIDATVKELTDEREAVKTLGLV